jgi:uncharacterized protein
MRSFNNSLFLNLDKPSNMETRLLELLVCPVCKGPLQHQRPPVHPQAELICVADQLAFPILDGIPVMLTAEARSLLDASTAIDAAQDSPV